MSSVTVDELVMRIEIELDKFRSQSAQAEAIDKKLRQSIKDTTSETKKAGEGFNALGDDIEETNKHLESNLKTLSTATTRLVGFFAAITSSNAVQRLATGVARINDELGFLERRLGMSARNITGLDTAIAALGGTNASARATIQQLNQGIQEMVLMGNDSLIPFFGALGVGVVDATGNIREMDDILLDMADSLSQMNPQQAYALANAMGLDDGVANALIQGRDALQEMLDLQKTIYVSTTEQIEASRELGKAQAFLGQQWDGLKVIIGNALIPALLRMTQIVSSWMEFLHRNERTITGLFEGLSIAIGAMLIPMLLKGAAAMFAMLSPVLLTAAGVALLAGGFALLYEDYKTWASGGNSLFDWDTFDNYIRKTRVSTDSLRSGFTYLLTGYKSLTEAGKAFTEWLKETGIYDEAGLHVDKLASAFKELTKEALGAIPGVQTILELLAAAMNGNWGEVLSIAKDIPSRVGQSVIDAGAGIVDRAKGALDIATSQPERGQADASEVQQIIIEAANRHGVPPEYLLAMAQQESSYNPNAIGPETKWGKAQGLFQYLPSTAESLGIDPLDPRQSADAAARQFAEMRAKGYSIEEAIMHHHAGPNRSLWGAKTADYGSSVSEKASAIRAKGLTNGYAPTAMPGGGTTNNNIEVNVGNVTVQTSATTLPAATKAGIEAGIMGGVDLMNQFGGIQ